MATADKCNITFGKPGTENATISIKLPPSVLENQVPILPNTIFPIFHIFVRFSHKYI
jgi:hypothetical protein